MCYGECDVSCGTGIQTRLDCAACESEKTTRRCNLPPCEWATDSWGICEAVCGRTLGRRSRSVYCPIGECEDCFFGIGICRPRAHEVCEVEPGAPCTTPSPWLTYLIATVPLQGDKSIGDDVQEQVQLGFVNASLPVQLEDISLSAGRNRESGQWKVKAILQVVLRAPSGSEAESWAQLAAEVIMGPPHLLATLDPEPLATTYDLITVKDPEFMTTVPPENTTEAPSEPPSTTATVTTLATTTTEPKASVFLAAGTTASELPAVSRKEVAEHSAWGITPSLVVLTVAFFVVAALLRSAWSLYARTPGLPYYAEDDDAVKSASDDLDPDGPSARPSKSSRSSDASDEPAGTRKSGPGGAEEGEPAGAWTKASKAKAAQAERLKRSATEPSFRPSFEYAGEKAGREGPKRSRTREGMQGGGRKPESAREAWDAGPGTRNTSRPEPGPEPGPEAGGQRRRNVYDRSAAGRSRASERPGRARGLERSRTEPAPASWAEVAEQLPGALTAADVDSALAAMRRADAQERKEAVRVLALRTHPDKGGDAAAFRLLTEKKAAFLERG